jgi:hypothetical protein
LGKTIVGGVADPAPHENRATSSGVIDPGYSISVLEMVICFLLIIGAVDIEFIANWAKQL